MRDTIHIYLILEPQVELRQEAIDLHGIAKLRDQPKALSVPLDVVGGRGEDSPHHPLHEFLSDASRVEQLPIPNVLGECILHQVVGGPVPLTELSR